MTMSKTCSSISRRPSLAAGGDDAVVADALETLGHGRGVRFVVVDHQDADLLVHRPIARGRSREVDLRIARDRCAGDDSSSEQRRVDPAVLPRTPGAGR